MDRFIGRDELINRKKDRKTDRETYRKTYDTYRKRDIEVKKLKQGKEKLTKQRKRGREKWKKCCILVCLY